MSKKQIIPTKTNPISPNSEVKKSIKPQSVSISFDRNLLVMVLCFIIIFVLQKQIVGYNWLWNTLIKENLDNQKRFPNLTEQQKAESKMGYDITYMYYINENTPKDAVILFPESSVVLNDSTPDQPKFRTKQGGIFSALWVQYFAFPRKVVFENEKGKNPNYEKISHVAIVNYKGYDQLPYKVNEKLRLGVLPIDEKLAK